MPCLKIQFYVISILLVSMAPAAELQPVRVAADGHGFVFSDSGRPFRVWGVNYDHDASGRLIEDYWQEEWSTVEADFAEIKALGANVVRVHLQFARFMNAPSEPNAVALRQLAKLLALAERTGLYLDLTGLGCYHKADVPPWYDKLAEHERWQAQAAFWQAVAQTCAGSPAVFCYDLMNEPIVPGEGKRDDWLGPAFAGKHFVQFITLELAGRPRWDVARQWTETLVAAIRQHDASHLITVGMVDWSLDGPGLTSGFVPQRVADQLDFIAVHLYPERGKLPAACATLAGFQIGKPIVVEETFPLKCSPQELAALIRECNDVAGWISFYWGQSAAECRESESIAGAITADWLETFTVLAATQNEQPTADKTTGEHR
jgi:hypothetical protein